MEPDGEFFKKKNAFNNANVKFLISDIVCDFVLCLSLWFKGMVGVHGKTNRSFSKS